MQLKYSKNKKLNTTKATAEYKKLWVQHWKESGQSVKSFVALHGGARSTFQRWVEADLILENTGVDTFHDGGGRPCYLDEENFNLLKQTIEELNLAQKSPDQKQFRELVFKFIKKSMTDRNTGVEIVDISDSFVSEVRNRLGAALIKSQHKPSARIKAESDPRNTYTMSAMAHAFCEFLDGNMIFNWDATQYIVLSDKDTYKVFIKSEKTEGKACTDESDGNLDTLIKLYHFHNAGGIVADPVFIIADDSMKDEEYEVHRIAGLSNKCGMGYGYLVVTKTRAANKAFYRWPPI